MELASYSFGSNNLVALQSQKRKLSSDSSDVRLVFLFSYVFTFENGRSYYKQKKQLSSSKCSLLFHDFCNLLFLGNLTTSGVIVVFVNVYYQVIRSLRAKLLAGCNVVLGPEIHPFWQLPAELGARCSTFCDHTTTHVVALDPGTDQALWAKEHDVFLVHPRWVDATSYLWSRPPEEDYPVTENPAGPAVVTFAKNVLVEPLIVDDTSDKGEVEPLVDLEPSKDETVSQATNAVELSGSSCLELPPTHVNGLSDASSVEDEDLEIE